MRVLSLSTLFPTSAHPGFGLFVARQAEAVCALQTVDLTMIAPIAIAPPPFHRVFHNEAERTVPLRSRYGAVEVHHPRYPYVPRIGWRINHRLIARAVLPLARRLHAKAPFDLVDAQYFYSDGPAALLIADALGLPLTVKARGSDIHHWGRFPHSRRLILQAAGRAAGLLAVSAALKRDMVALGIAEDRIAVHYTGLDHNLFRPWPRAEARTALASSLAIPVDGPLLAAVGNLIPLKGQDLVIKALASLPAARLVLAGKGPEEEALRALAQRTGVAERVHWAGSIPPALMANMLSAADAMVLPSEREGLANAWIEALACGTPLVIPDVGGAREVVTAPSAGRIIARAVPAIVEAVRSLLADPPDQAAVVTHATQYDWARNAAQLEAFWRRAAGGR